ncbi:antirestriction protein ArdA [Sphingobacterium sp.]|uniref:antirestriction protein ArdA n=1 Tax=Sphingobacterium sp. TaxID=341027 RepID=UPI0031E2076A
MNARRNYPIDIEEAAVYVGTYGKYNDGSLFGKWLKLSDYSNVQEFYAACRELHKDEADPEFMFQDYENIPEGLISECGISEQVFEVLQTLTEMESSEREPFMIWCNNDHYDLGKEDIDDLVNRFQDDYVGMYKDEEAFAYELIEERDDIRDFAKQFFDYEAYANDLFCSDYWYEDGHVFYKN